MDPYTNLINACAIYLGNVSVPQYTPLQEGDRVLAKMEPDDVARFAEIQQKFKSLAAHAGRTMRLAKRLHAMQILFWEDVYEKYESMQLQEPVPVGLRADATGAPVLVALHQTPE